MFIIIYFNIITSNYYERKIFAKCSIMVHHYFEGVAHPLCVSKASQQRAPDQVFQFPPVPSGAVSLR